jgi:hypothetical protein
VEQGIAVAARWPPQPAIHLYCWEMIKSVANHSSTRPHTCSTAVGTMLVLW